MFRDIGKGIVRRTSALKGAAEFSRKVSGVITTLYPRVRGPMITHVRHEAVRRCVYIRPASLEAERLLVRDRELIRAALRSAGLDIREVRFREAHRKPR